MVTFLQMKGQNMETQLATINTDNYYIFIKKQKYNKNNKNFYKALLNNLS